MPLGAFKAALMGTAGVSAAGDVVLLSTQTASGASEISFTSGITSTYGEYIFKVYNFNPGTDTTNLQFEVSDDAGSSYGLTKTSSSFYTYHKEDDSAAALAYNGTLDIAEGSGAQGVVYGVGNGADESAAGELHLFNPSSTTYVKHYISKFTSLRDDDQNSVWFIGGYVNDTSAVTALKFTASSGTFDGKFKMWGVK